MVKAFPLIQYYFFETKFIWSKINKTILKIDDVGSKEKYIHIMQNRTQENALRKCYHSETKYYLLNYTYTEIYVFSHDATYRLFINKL